MFTCRPAATARSFLWEHSVYCRQSGNLSAPSERTGEIKKEDGVTVAPGSGQGPAPPLQDLMKQQGWSITYSTGQWELAWNVDSWSIPPASPGPACLDGLTHAQAPSPAQQVEGVIFTSLLVFRTGGWDPGGGILRGAPTERLCPGGSWMDCGRISGCCPEPYRGSGMVSCWTTGQSGGGHMWEGASNMHPREPHVPSQKNDRQHRVAGAAVLPGAQ